MLVEIDDPISFAIVNITANSNKRGFIKTYVKKQNESSRVTSFISDIKKALGEDNCVFIDDGVVNV